MLPNAFIGKTEKPSHEELAAELGSAKVLWDDLLLALAAECNADIHEWKSYSRKAGWSLRVLCKKRAIVYLSPCRGSFRASFALSDKAVEEARESKLPPKTLKIIEEAKRYPEGTAVRIDVTGPKDAAVVKKLAAIKLKN